VDQVGVEVSLTGGRFSFGVREKGGGRRERDREGGRERGGGGGGKRGRKERGEREEERVPIWPLIVASIAVPTWRWRRSLV
jgi:hypothetical protein